MNKKEPLMKVKVNWVVDLPLKFLNRNDFKKTSFSDKRNRSEGNFD